MPRIIPQEIRSLLSDKLWLEGMHVQQLFSIVELSKILHVTPNVVRKALRKEGVAVPSQQALREASNKRKYGVANPGSIKEFRDKAMATMTERFGGHCWSTKGNRAKRNETCKQRYGTEAVGGTRYSIDKVRETNMAKYGRAHAKQSHISIENLAKLDDKDWLHNQHIVLKKTLSQIAAECGTNMSTIMNRLRSFGMDTQLHPTSFEEKQVGDYLRSLGMADIVTNSRAIISPKELDIYLPEFRLAIEHCGLYWHGETAGKPRLYHKNKMVDCNKKGIRLITIYDSEWRHKQECVKRTLAAILNRSQDPTVYARKCEVRQVTTEQKQRFFGEFHLQGDGPSSINYGLFCEQKCVGVIGFVQQAKGVFVLNRYATNCNVPGGFSKLLSHFCKNHEWSKIVSFADQRWSEGGVYEKNGFTLDKVLPPDYAYIVKHVPCHKFNFRRKYLKQRLAVFDPNLSEWENCKANNIDRIWDCGKKRYVLTNPKTPRQSLYENKSREMD